MLMSLYNDIECSRANSPGTLTQREVEGFYYDTDLTESMLHSSEREATERERVSVNHSRGS